MNQEINIGDTVIDRWGNRGFIKNLYDDFGAVENCCKTMSGNEWLDQQLIPFSEEQLQEMWAGVICDTGGAIGSPISLLTLY